MFQDFSEGADGTFRDERRLEWRSELLLGICKPYYAPWFHRCMGCVSGGRIRQNSKVFVRACSPFFAILMQRIDVHILFSGVRFGCRFSVDLSFSPQKAADEPQDPVVAQSAFMLYGMIHARFIVTARGLEAMVRHFCHRCCCCCCCGCDIRRCRRDDVVLTFQSVGA